MPALLDRPLAYRTLALTGTFETSAHPPDCFACVAGDFDGQGMSFGALQWNLGQGTLQPLLREMDRQHHDVVLGVFDDHYQILMAMLAAPREEQLAWARSIQDPRHRLIEPWSGLFKALGRREEFQRVQVAAARRGVKVEVILDKRPAVRAVLVGRLPAGRSPQSVSKNPR